jgi:hypothetical protein
LVEQNGSIAAYFTYRLIDCRHDVINNGKKDTDQDTSINPGNLNSNKGKPNSGVFTEKNTFTNFHEPFIQEIIANEYKRTAIKE